MTTRPEPRTGVTLIELLVVMAIITALGLLALMLLPGINNSDAALKATEEVRANVKIAQALAGAARQPRGVRFLTGSVAANPLAATELQLLESPPVMAIDPLALVARSDSAAGTTGVAGPYVEFEYLRYTGPGNPMASPATADDVSIDPRQPGVVPPPDTLKRRQCKVYRLTVDQKDQIQDGALLALPTLGFWSRIQTNTAMTPPNTIVVSAPYTVAGVQYYDVVLPLEIYPDAQLGAATHYRTYHAGIYGVPIPLLGQPTIPLPKDIAVDLEVSVPPATVGTPYDVMFAPDGQTIMVGRQSNNAGVYLWVRDITKVVNPTAPVALRTSMKWSQTFTPAYADGPEYGPANPWEQAFRRGGEHHAVAISNGAVGTAAIQWPNAAGTFPEGNRRENVFAFVRRKAN